MPEERLQKILSQAGVASRRQAEKIMLEGRVTVNGKVPEPRVLVVWSLRCACLLAAVWSTGGKSSASSCAYSFAIVSGRVSLVPR